MDNPHYIIWCRLGCLDVPYSDDCSEKTVIIYPHKHGGDNQLWFFENNKIISVINKQLCLDVKECIPGSEVVLNNQSASNIKWCYRDNHIW